MLRKFDTVQWWKRHVRGAGLAGLIVAASLATAAPARAEHSDRYWHHEHGGWGVYVDPAVPGPYYYPAYPYYYGPPGYYYSPPAVGFGFSFH